MRPLRIVSLLAGIGLALTVAACGSSSPPPAPVEMSAALNGRQEVPPTESLGTGEAAFTFDRSTRHLSWRITYQGLSGPITGAHLHGPADQRGSAGVVLAIPTGPSPLVGAATLDERQALDLVGGRLYLDLHTASHPEGEIRGQVLPGRLVAAPPPPAPALPSPAEGEAAPAPEPSGTPFLGPRLSPEIQPLGPPPAPPR